MLPDIHQELLEKPTSKTDNLRMLLDMNGGVCEVVTGVSIGKYSSDLHITRVHQLIIFICFLLAVYPVLASPGYDIK